MTKRHVRALCSGAVLICLALAAPSGHATEQQFPQGLGPYLATHFKTPEEYICDKFKSHDLVIVGELHYVRQHLDLLHRLLPTLYRDCGVRFLGYEFYASSLQSEIDTLVTAKEYDEALAMKILREQAARTGVMWAYEDYIDTFKVVWEVNQTVDQPSEKMRIIFMMPDIDFGPLHHGTEAEKTQATLQFAACDKHYADQIIKEYDHTGRKGLIWCGSTHALTRLKGNPPNRPKRMGTYLYDRYGDKVFMIRLHQPMRTLKGMDYLLGGELDRALREFGKPVGFDIAESPLANVKLPRECVWTMDNPGATLSAYNDGYIWLAPIEELQGVQVLDLNQVVPDEQTFKPIGRNCAEEVETRGEYLAVWKKEAEELSRDFPTQRIFRHFPQGFVPPVSSAKPKVEPPPRKNEEPKPSAETHVPLPVLDPELRDRLISYLKSHAMTPEEYVISKFRDHDVVCIGEVHRIKHDVELTCSLIPLLHKNGIFTLCTEFARREDQPLIDKLLEGDDYDEALAREIMFREMVDWGFQEYVDIYRAAWEVNRHLPPGARKFRILGVNDSPDWSLLQKPEDRNNSAIMRKVWHGGGEDCYAQVILDNVVAKGEKALVYSGLHHAFTEYNQPIAHEGRFIRFESERMGNYLYRAIGKKVITISLHMPWYSVSGYGDPTVYPADGVIDALMRSLPPDLRRVGFDTQGTPFGELTGKTAIYSQGYDHFTLATFCDGYIIQKPLSEYTAVTVIPNFINATNLERARLGMAYPEDRRLDVEALMQAMAREADVRRKYFPHLQ